MNDSSLSGSKGSANDKLPEFIPSSEENHGSSNPVEGCFRYTHGGESPTAGANRTLEDALSAIIAHAF